MEKLKVLFASSEVVPFAKTGGLADVAGSLPKALKNLDVDIRVVMPKYKDIPQQYVDQMEYIGYIYVDIGWRHQYCGLLKTEYDGVTIYFIDNEYYFNRNGLYGYHDEAEQFIFFSKALIEMLPCIQFQPDIIHCNDWQTGVVSLLLNARYKQQDFFRNIKTVFTIHNLKYQGVFPKEVLTDILGISWEHFTVDKIEFYDQINCMKAGLAYSDIINTVSKTYAEEIKHDFFGENLQDMIRKRSENLYGIVNGIDMETNNPASDQRLFANYDVNHLEGKYENKRELQRVLGLPVRNDVPVIGIISRLVAQKGLDLISCVLHDMLHEDLQLVILGTGESIYEQLFIHAASLYPAKVSANIKYDGTLAQRIYAGSDMFLMPSLFEPCGLSQLFSLRYGAIPIVRETGGLNDTVQSYNELTNEGNGFSFTNYNAQDMLHTIKRAIHFYQDKEIWNALIRRGMSADYSWNKSAEEYVELYHTASSK
ncbi:glycogen synthase GlgA [Petroclostridium sp. X23]|uniref:glycogen synthase GlgA n=1 Tax=Petroclostridium sp. X23 TaxID=3045146 RepID=UPI0024ADAEAB|nr:glycogen synthase GlgA [Petroclostridium sp. X23]WHH57431.1 glycogen synthase GlgA [Petroclostridium sp. X23]